MRAAKADAAAASADVNELLATVLAERDAALQRAAKAEAEVEKAAAEKAEAEAEARRSEAASAPASDVEKGRMEGVVSPTKQGAVGSWEPRNSCSPNMFVWNKSGPNSLG